MSMNDVCPKCEKKVYFAERLTFQKTYWHKTCFRCEECNKRIGTAAEALDNNGEPYCKSCYSKNFGPKGYGFHGGAGAGVMGAANDKVVNSVKAKKKTKEELQKQVENTAVSFLTAQEKAADKAPDGGKKPLYGWAANNERSGYDQEKKKTEEKKEKTKASKFGGSPKCPICGKSVFFAESLKALGETFHKTCFQCTDCAKRMNTAGDAVDGKGLVYCKSCYAKRFGPKGIGFGTLGDTGIDRSALTNNKDV